MNRKHIQEDASEYAVRHSRKRDIVAAVICLVLAFVVWLLVMNAEDTTSVALEVQGGDAAYTYTLSVDSVEVAGRVVAIKAAQRENIIVKVPARATLPGVYQLSLEQLVLPEGVALTSLPEIVLTVSPK